MTGPCDPEAAPEARDEEQVVVLRLGDILPGVPAHLLKPGPHDTMARVRFSVEELAKKIARGRVTVPLERLASACPDVFQDGGALSGEEEIQLPLQKLLPQIGLHTSRSSADNGMPGDQLARARAQASRIIGSRAPAPPTDSAPPPPGHSTGIAKAISTVFGLFGRPNDSGAKAAAPEQLEESAPPSTEKRSPPLASEPNADMPTAPQPATAAQPAHEPVAQLAMESYVSLRVLPIFRLLPGMVLRSGTLPPQEARVTLPLSAIDPQLAGGHVEVPLEDFIKHLSEELRQRVNPVPKTQVWIPLDEIFQNLPPDHLFYMPPLDPLVEPAATPTIHKPPSAGTISEKRESPPAGTEPAQPAEPLQDLSDNVGPRPAPGEPPPPATPQSQEPVPAAESSPQPTRIDPAPIPEAVAVPAPVEIISTSPAPETVSAPQDIKVEPSPPPTPTPSPEPAQSTPIPPPIPEPPSEAPPTPFTPPPSLAPHMHGVQIPPPPLFSGVTPAEPPSETAPVEPSSPAPAPEPKRLADFLATQPGIFAAAAFVQGAAFASAHFPLKPDLDAVRDFMGAFIDGTRDSAGRLGWDRVLTIACEQFHLTAVFRDSHFIVALHYDRVLPPLTHDALITAADDLSEAAG